MRRDGGDHWESPDPRKLLVTAHRVADTLDVPLWKGYELCHVLERVFIGEGQTHFRVTLVSLNAFKDLLEQGLPMDSARELMWTYKRRGALPPPGAVEGPEVPISHRRRRRRADTRP
jgi:hypothetical protein